MGWVNIISAGEDRPANVIDLPEKKRAKRSTNGGSVVTTDFEDLDQYLEQDWSIVVQSGDRYKLVKRTDQTGVILLSIRTFYPRKLVI